MKPPTHFVLLYIHVPRNSDDDAAERHAVRVVLTGAYDSYEDAESEAMFTVAREPAGSVVGYAIIKA